MALVKPELSKELVVNVLQQEDGKVRSKTFICHVPILIAYMRLYNTTMVASRAHSTPRRTFGATHVHSGIPSMILYCLNSSEYFLGNFTIDSSKNIQEGETVQIRIESNTMGSEVDLEEDSQPVDEVEEVHENVEMAGKMERNSSIHHVLRLIIPDPMCAGGRVKGFRRKTGVVQNISFA